MTASVAQQYIDLLEGNESAVLALLACSAALRLDDEMARQVIELVAQSNGSTPKLLHQIKGLGCVWKQWDGSWYIAEDVRSHLVEHLNERLSEPVRLHLRSLLAAHARRRGNLFSPDGQISTYRARQAKFEAAYQTTLIPEQSQNGAEQFAEIWIESPGSAKEATARSVDYLASEISRHLRHLPTEVLFLQGMAARSRKDKRAQEKYFRAVWERRNSGLISAIAAHLYGLLIQRRDRDTAERALRDSIEWNDSPHYRGQVYHSLGNLLTKERRRWPEAEQAFRKSIELRRGDAFGEAQTWHSLGNLLSKERRRWPEAEQAFRKSIQLDTDVRSQAETWHSLGNLLSKERRRWPEAEQAFRKSVRLRTDDPHQGQVYHSLGNLLSKERRRWPEAEQAFRKSIELRRGDAFGEAQIWHSLGNLLSKEQRRWPEAEQAYRKSIELRPDDPPGKAQVLASWASALLKDQDDINQSRAEKLALDSLEIDPDTPRTNAICYRILADIYERRGEIEKAIGTLKSWMQANRRLGEHELNKRIQSRLSKLEQRHRERH